MLELSKSGRSKFIDAQSALMYGPKTRIYSLEPLHVKYSYKAILNGTIDKVSKILEGANRYSPTYESKHFPKDHGGVGAALDAKKARILGIVLKDHHTPTTDRAYLAHKTVPEVEVFGGNSAQLCCRRIKPLCGRCRYQARSQDRGDALDRCEEP
ncbi:MAG: DUF6282 family protein [Candidatus Bathyarchaeia archaeon]